MQITLHQLAKECVSTCELFIASCRTHPHTRARTHTHTQHKCAHTDAIHMIQLQLYTLTKGMATKLATGRGTGLSSGGQYQKPKAAASLML